MPHTLTWAGRRAGAAASLLCGLALASCGGGSGSNPFDNPADVKNPASSGGQELSFAYFQRCVYPIFLAELPVRQGSATSVNTCASSGCHHNVQGTGGAFRVVPNATPVDLANAANTADVVRATDMYRNFYSAQAAAIVGAATQSRLLTKPLVQGVLHGGGVVFESSDDPNARILAYWIGHPMPAGQDEFSSAGANLFTPADATTGACNSQ
ncbi:MAG TPA: hypothetical protein VHM00_03485 [Caldimonas sp.]|jgi:hypothetical protein|nr:hypothetical protein [Caldimonas sp.]HEX2540126.1 hypothetical protein [Caldimonas sp.]